MPSASPLAISVCVFSIEIINSLCESSRYATTFSFACQLFCAQAFEKILPRAAQISRPNVMLQFIKYVYDLSPLFSSRPFLCVLVRRVSDCQGERYDSFAMRGALKVPPKRRKEWKLRVHNAHSLMSIETAIKGARRFVRKWFYRCKSHVLICLRCCFLPMRLWIKWQRQNVHSAFERKSLFGRRHTFRIVYIQTMECLYICVSS